MRACALIPQAVLLEQSEEVGHRHEPRADLHDRPSNSAVTKCGPLELYLMRGVDMFTIGRSVRHKHLRRSRLVAPFRRRASHRDDRGATMVEFALMAIPLVGLLLGIMEFSWAFNQQQDVRYGAREGARVAAVSNINGTNATPTAQQIVNVVCSRMDSSGPKMHVSVQATSSVAGNPPTTGDQAVIQITKPLQQITGFYAWMLNGNTIKSKISFRLEQPVTWSNTSAIVQSGSTISGGLTCPS